MTRRIATTKTAEPAAMPVIVESSAQRLAWQRDMQNARDERDLIDAQIHSAERTAVATKTEATAIRDARINYANSAMDREYADAEKILAATTASLRNRQFDLDRVITGLGAAINASGENQPDGVPSE